ncbi:MAG: hypothetical protein AAF488_13290 [Planctomycetota bacterium]
MAFGDKLKKALGDAGDKVGRLTKRGKLEVERLEVEGDLRRRHQELGKFVAQQFIEKGNTELLREDPHVRPLIDSVERTEKRLQAILDEAEQVKGDD